jgi:hypothetical protein
MNENELALLTSTLETLEREKAKYDNFMTNGSEIMDLIQELIDNLEMLDLNEDEE